MLRVSALFAFCLASALSFVAAPAEAGTQDFTVVNRTGFVIYQMFVSESTSDNWEEDVLGEGVLANGGSIDVTFSGHDACLWDLMVVDADGGQEIWQALNLCEISVAVLRCDDTECWAEYE